MLIEINFATKIYDKHFILDVNLIWWTRQRWCMKSVVDIFTISVVYESLNVSLLVLAGLTQP